MHYWRGLHVTKFSNLRENLPKVSGQIPRYSRFWETFRGDNFDLHCVVGLAGELWPSVRSIRSVHSTCSPGKFCLRKAGPNPFVRGTSRGTLCLFGKSKQKCRWLCECVSF